MFSKSNIAGTVYVCIFGLLIWYQVAPFHEIAITFLSLLFLYRIIVCFYTERKFKNYIEVVEQNTKESVNKNGIAKKNQDKTNGPTKHQNTDKKENGIHNHNNSFSSSNNSNHKKQ